METLSLSSDCGKEAQGWWWQQLGLQEGGDIIGVWQSGRKQGG